MNRNRENADQSLDLGRYIGANDEEYRNQQYHQPHKYLHPQQTNMKINRLNMILQAICSQKLGDLTSNSDKQVQKTLQLVQALISEIKKFQQLKMKLIGEKKQFQKILDQKQNTIDKLTKQKKNLQNQKQNYIQKFKFTQKNLKQALQKSQSQKQDLNKQIKQHQLRQKTFEAQFRKKQTQIKAYQDSIKKFQEKHPFKNSFEVLQKFQYGPNIYDLCSTNGQNQYSRLAKDSRDQSYKRLCQQNNHQKQILIYTQKQLKAVLELKMQTLKNKKGYDGEFYQNSQLNSYRLQSLRLPFPFNNESLKQYKQNIHKFIQLVKVGDTLDNKVDEKKQNCVNSIRKLITNYKQVVQTQQQLLNKVLLKSKEFKVSELNHLQNKFSKVLDSQQIDRSKRFIQEHTQFLEVKNAEYERQKKLMQSVIKKAEQSRKQMFKQRQVFEEEALEMRKSIEVLPAMIEQQLGKAMN